MSNNIDREKLASQLLDALAHCRLSDTDREIIRAQVITGDRLDEVYLSRQFFSLPGQEAAGMRGQRPLYTLATWPAPPPADAPGGATKTLAQLLDVVQERGALVVEYGQEAVEAASPPSREPII